MEKMKNVTLIKIKTNDDKDAVAFFEIKRPIPRPVKTPLVHSIASFFNFFVQEEYFFDFMLRKTANS